MAVFGRMNLYEALKTDYMASFASFVQNYWLIFLTGALMGKIYEITNGAKSIARVIVKLFGKIRIGFDSACLRYSCLWWCLCLRCIICGFPIALEVFHEADLPKLYSAALCFGCSTFAMVAPGAPQIQNAIPSSAVGEDLMAGIWLLVFISVVSFWLWAVFALMRMVAAQKAKVHHSLLNRWMYSAMKDTKLPHPLVAFIPLIVTIILINVKINGQVICQLETGVLAGSVLALIMMWKYQDRKAVLGHVGDTCKSSLNAICNTSAVVAFGGVVKLAPAFAAVVNAMLNIHGPKIHQVLRLQQPYWQVSAVLHPVAVVLHLRC